MAGWYMMEQSLFYVYTKPGLNEDAYYTRKFNYGLNLQIGHNF